MKKIFVKNLPEDWRLRESYTYCQAIGNNWYYTMDTLILKVPSAIISDEFNYGIKTTLQSINRIEIREDKPFIPDERLENILISVDINKLKKLSVGR